MMKPFQISRLLSCVNRFGVRTQAPFSSTSGNHQVDLTGIFPPVPTPFTAKNGDIAFDKLKHNLELFNKIPFRGYVLQGSNGEYVFLSTEERIHFAKEARKHIPSGKLLICGSGCESTRETILLCQKMADVGVEAVMVVTPSYFKSELKDSALFSHFEQVADQSPIPVLLYNVPGKTGVDMSADVVAKLASHQNIIGLKESGGNIVKITSILHKTEGQDFQVLAGSADFMLAALHMGCVGGVCALANVLGAEVCRLHQLFQENKFNEALQLQKRLLDPNAAVTKLYGVAGLKHIMPFKGLYGGPTRSPLQELDTEAAKVEECFTKSGFLN